MTNFTMTFTDIPEATYRFEYRYENGADWTSEDNGYTKIYNRHIVPNDDKNNVTTFNIPFPVGYKANVSKITVIGTVIDTNYGTEYEKIFDSDSNKVSITRTIDQVPFLGYIEYLV